MDYDLDRLGWREFEHMSQSLAMAELGNGVQIFGAGPDGGREATFEGSVQFPVGHETPWTGYGVIQAKHREITSTPESNLLWLKQHIRQELDNWRPDDLGRIRRSRRPDYYLLITNVRLSAGPGGGADSATEFLLERAERIGIKGVFVWHYDSIARLLDQHVDIRQTYAGFLTTGDVLQQVQSLLSRSEIGNIARHLRIHAANQLIAKQWIRLGQAGFDGSEKLALGEAATDLPGIINRPGEAVEVQVLQHVLERGNSSLRPSVRGGLEQGIVLIGGPGQGKSTLSQLISQIYRAALVGLDNGGSLGPEADKVLETLRSNMERLELSEPACKRWPALVDLSKFADETSDEEEPSIVQYIASQLLVQGQRPPGADLSEWLRAWPWVVVFDGLDEVASADSRDKVISAISRFVVELNVDDCDVLLLATTRPQGYNDEFGVFRPEIVNLRALERNESIAYADRIVSVRHRNDPEMIVEIQSRFRNAASDSTTSRLVGSPLQATIMTYLLEDEIRAPQTRQALFSLYYDTIYSREANKPGALGELLAKHREDVDYFHEQAGLLLQVRGEKEGDSESLLETGVLRKIVVERLSALGHHPDIVAELADELLHAATHRVVLLEGGQRGQVGFAVRSLQEYMAARAIASGPPDEILDRLRALGPSAHWRNVWLLAAGRIFAMSHMRDGLIGVLRSLDEEPLPSATLIGFGERIAIDLLDDNIAARYPGMQRMLLQHALGRLKRWPGPELKQLVTVIAQLGLETDSASYKMIKSALTSASLEGTGRTRLSAYIVLLHMTRSNSAWSNVSRLMLSEQFSNLDVVSSGPPYPATFAELMGDKIRAATGEARVGERSRELVAKLGEHKYRWLVGLMPSLADESTARVSIQVASSYSSLLRDFDTECALVGCIEDLAQDEAIAAMWATQLIQTDCERRPVGTDPRLMLAGYHWDL